MDNIILPFNLRPALPGSSHDETSGRGARDSDYEISDGYLKNRDLEKKASASPGLPESEAGSEAAAFKKYTRAERSLGTLEIISFLKTFGKAFRISGEAFDYAVRQEGGKKGDLQKLIEDLELGVVSFGRKKLILRKGIEGNIEKGETQSYLRIQQGQEGALKASLFIQGKPEEVERLKRLSVESGLYDKEEWRDRKFSKKEYLISILPGGSSLLERKYMGKTGRAAMISDLSQVARYASFATAFATGQIQGLIQYAYLGAPGFLNALAGIAQTHRRHKEMEGEEQSEGKLGRLKEAVKLVLHPLTSVLGDKDLMARVNVSLAAHGFAQDFVLYQRLPEIDILTHFLSGHSSTEVADRMLTTAGKDMIRLSGIEKRPSYQNLKEKYDWNPAPWDLIRKMLIFSVTGLGWEKFERVVNLEKDALNGARDMIMGGLGVVAGWWQSRK
jgi:hypothetical protein